MSDVPDERWQVGDLTIGVGGQAVVRNGIPVPLPRLSFKFLMALVRASPGLVSADELMDQVWTGIFVNSETVTQRAKLLRDALGDDPKQPRYFIVRRGIGYQLIPSPVRLDGSSLSPPAQAASANRRVKIALALAVFTLVPLGGLAVTVWPSGQKVVQNANLRVAVLPFDNLSSDPSDAYIARSIPEMVLNRLSTVQGLTVIARDSALMSPASGAAAREAGRELKAAFVVKGSVQKLEQTLRVTCFVLDTDKDTRLWSQSFDWPIVNLYALQDRIAERVASSLSARTAALGTLSPMSQQTDNPDAYLAYLKGKSLLGRFTVAETEAAAAQFQRAVDLDPGFAPAMIALYDARMQAASLRSENLAPVRARYDPLLMKARQIDPGSGAALFAEAMWSNRPRADRLALFERAAEKDPSNSRGLTAYAQFVEWGRRDDTPSALGQQLIDRVMAIDPLSADAEFWSVQRTVFYARSRQETEAALRRALALDPDNILLANRFAMRRWRMAGQTAEGISLMEQVIARDPQYARSAHVAVAMYLDVGDLAAARAVAASTTATRESSRALLALYQNDWRGAGEAALGPRGFLFNPFENYLWPDVVSDYAIRTRQLDRGAQAIATRYGFDLASPRVTTLYQTLAAAPLAEILLGEGKREIAMRLLAQTVRWVDEHPKLGFEGGNGRVKASALMLIGQRNEALSVLLAATQNAHDIRHCWYLTGQDRVWAAVHGDPRFREVAAICNASIRTQRILLEEMRRAGKVPTRHG